MRKTLLEVAVYPLLLINIAIGFVMLMGSHTLILIFISRLNQDGAFEDVQLGPFFAIQESASIISIVVMAIIALIAFPLLERYYTNGVKQDELIQRVCLTVGMQLIFVGVLYIMTRLVAEVGISLDVYLTLIGGIILFAISRKLPSNLTDSELPD